MCIFIKKNLTVVEKALATTTSMGSLLPFLRHSSGILRYAVDSKYSLCFRRMMSGGVSPSAPWLMLPPALDGGGNIAYTYYCLARNEYLVKKKKIDAQVIPPDIDDVKFVGSSYGWLAFSHWSNSGHLFLSSPITGRHVRLPSPPRTLFCTAPERVILSSPICEGEEEEEEEEPIAFMIFGSPGKGRLALCRPRQTGSEWTRMGELDDVYEHIVYSSRHKRLFCVCHRNYNKEKITLECWDVDVDVDVALDWEVEELYLKHSSTLSGLKEMRFQMNYLVCAEHSGELFLVVRHVNRRAGPDGEVVDKEDDYEDTNYTGDPDDVNWKEVDEKDDGMSGVPYKTVDFDVYKIDTKTGKVKYMKRCLQGLAMFVGISHPVAIPAAVAGVKADSIYFSDENLLVEATRLEEATKSNYGGHDNGIFDYGKKKLSQCCHFYPIEYQKIRKILPLPLWFSPTTTTS